MPILPPEPDRYPPHLLDPVAAGEFGPDRQWWVLHTKPRQEKALARRLRAAGVSFYLPAVARRSRIRGKVLTAHVPLFSGYVFLLGDRDERVTALATDCVVNTLRVHDPDRLWSDLRQIDRLIASGAPVTAESSLPPGTRVEITTGPLAGLTGTLVRTESGRRFVVQVDFIQQGASVLLEDCSVLPLRGAVSARGA